MFIFLTVVQAIVAAALVGSVLMQRSEGGGLGIGGNPSGGIGARGSADFLTRATKWLAVVFVVLSIVLAALAVRESGATSVTSTLERGVAAPAAPDLLADPVAPAQSTPAEPAPAAPASEDPLSE
ncbi:MAG: preprotein translocase subunit SecG [Alphaproteobacteria bacterium HGW-Alphaproteobacteria-14]|nr:MAG: preprotein translocase subunit SecG [Alphaproteobacteria bacterium HGW-Alphaproteobacteria-14]